MFRFIFPIILLFFSASLYFDYIVPSSDKIEVLNKDIKKTNIALDTQKGDIEETLAKLKEDKESIDPEKIKKLNRLVPQQSDFDEAVFANDMNNIAIRHGMVINNIQLSNQSSVTKNSDSADNTDNINGGYGMFKMQFSVESSYKEFIKFMKEIEQNEQLMDVNVTSFQGKDEGDYNYSVALTTYWLK